MTLAETIPAWERLGWVVAEAGEGFVVLVPKPIQPRTHAYFVLLTVVTFPLFGIFYAVRALGLRKWVRLAEVGGEVVIEAQNLGGQLAFWPLPASLR